MITQNHRGLLAMAADSGSTGSPSGDATGTTTTNGSTPSADAPGASATADGEEIDYAALLDANGSKLDAESKEIASVDLNAEVPVKGKEAPVEAAPAAAAAEETPVGEESADEDEDDEPAKAETNPDGTPKKEAKNFRVNLDGATDAERKRAFIRILKNEKGVTMEEAARRTGVKLDAAATPQSKEPSREQPQTQADDPRPAMREEITKLQKDADKANDEELDAPKARRLDKQVAEKQRELDRLDEQARQKDQARNLTQAQEFEAAVTESWKGVADLFPDAFKRGSELQTALEGAIAERHQKDPGFFKNPEWPAAFAMPFLLKRGVAPKGAAPATPAAPVASKVTPKKALTPVKPPAPAPGGASDGATPGWTAESGQTIEDWLEKHGTKLPTG